MPRYLIQEKRFLVTYKKKVSLLLLIAFCSLNSTNATFHDRGKNENIGIVRQNAGQLVWTNNYDVSQKNQPGENDEIIEAVSDNDNDKDTKDLSNKSEDSFEHVNYDQNVNAQGLGENNNKELESCLDDLKEIKSCHDDDINKGSNNDYYQKYDSELRNKLGNWFCELQKIKLNFDENKEKAEGYQALNINIFHESLKNNVMACIKNVNLFRNWNNLRHLLRHEIYDYGGGLIGIIRDADMYILKFFDGNQNLRSIFTQMYKCGNMDNMAKALENLGKIKVMKEQVLSPADIYYNAISNHFVKLISIVQQGIGLLLGQV